MCRQAIGNRQLIIVYSLLTIAEKQVTSKVT